MFDKIIIVERVNVGKPFHIIVHYVLQETLWLQSLTSEFLTLTDFLESINPWPKGGKHYTHI